MKRAVILCAGMGSRLKPVTCEQPKCMTEIRSTPILINTLDILDKCNIDETWIVIGYMGDKIEERVGSKYSSMPIKYITNDVFESTNSMYSLWLAREAFNDETIVIEGDCYFEEDVMKAALQIDNRSVWVVDKFHSYMNGSMQVTNGSDNIIQVKIVKESPDNVSDNHFKSTGIVRLLPDYGLRLRKWLDDDVNNEDVNIYYDEVIAKHISEYPLYIASVEGKRWIEIDDRGDILKAEKMCEPMKYVVVIADGASDETIPALRNKTPFEFASLPTLDKITDRGRTGLLRTSFDGLPVGSVVANMGIMGYSPHRYYPNGRASFEALAQNICLNEGDVAFRCNLISVDNDCISDFTAGNIDDSTALKIIDSIDLGEDAELYYGQSYRNILIIRDASFLPDDVVCREPHMNIGKKVNDVLIKGLNERGRSAADMLNALMMEMRCCMSRLSEGIVSSADMCWLWSPSFVPILPSFHSKNNMTGAVVCGLDFLRGIASCASMQEKEIRGTTGMLDTNYKEKLKHAMNFLRHNDYVYIHINAPDEESHRRDPQNKVLALENIDSEILRPLVDHMDSHYANNYRIAYMPDHYTLLRDGTHCGRPVPFVICGHGIERDSVETFCEVEIEKASGDIVNSYEFMSLLTRI